MSQQLDANGNPMVPQQQAHQQPAQTMSPAYPQQGQGQAQPPMQLDPNQVPDYLRQEDPEQRSGLGAGAGVGGPRLSIKGKQFRFIEGDNERPFPFGQPLNVVLLTTDPHEGVAKNFYGQAYVEGEDQSPKCYSSDGITPDAGVEEAQSATCATCPHNKFGTARNQDGTPAKGKACRDFKRVYVIPFDEPSSEPFELRVPPTSFKGMQTYGSKLDKVGVKMYGVVTQLNFTADTSPVLSFTFAGYLSQEVVQYLEQRIKSGELDSVRPSLHKQPAEYSGATQELPAPPDHVQQAPEQAAPQGQMQTQAPQPQAQMAPQQTPPAPAPEAPAAPQAPAPCPMGAPAGMQMTGKAPGVTYDAFIQSNWSDQMLISEGYMVRV